MPMSHVGCTRLRLVLSAFLLGMSCAFAVPGIAQAADPVDLFLSDVHDDPDPAHAYTTITYTMYAGNRGPGTASAVTVTAQLPLDVSFRPSASDDRCEATLDTVTCDLGALPGNAMASPLLIGLTSTRDRVLSLTFTVSTAESDVDPADNTRTETTTISTPADADISLRLSATMGPIYAGEMFFFSAEVGNSGPAPATGVTAVLRIPAGVTVVSPEPGCVPDGAESVCTVGPLELPPSSGSIAILGLTASASGDYEISGYATADQPDPDPADNTDSGPFTVLPASDLAVTVAESADPALPGQPLAYTMTVANHGPSPASDVSLTDEWSSTLPGGLELLGVESSQGICAVTASGSADCRLGGLASGVTATVTITFRPRGTGTVTNHAEVTATEADRDPANNLATEPTSVR